MSSILIIEDDPDIRRLVAGVLARAGYEVHSEATALDGLGVAMRSKFDLIVLDLGLPDLDGGELLRMLRSVTEVPVIIATARADDAEAARLLDAGADDHLVKPFSTQQLEARVRAVLRRSGSGVTARDVVRVGDLVIDASAREVHLQGDLIDLSPKEFDLLRHLASNVGHVVSRRQLLAEVWQEPLGGSERTVDVHLSSLRKKLGESGSQPRYLRTVHGVGVRLVAPDHDAQETSEHER